MHFSNVTSRQGRLRKAFSNASWEISEEKSSLINERAWNIISCLNNKLTSRFVAADKTTFRNHYFLHLERFGFKLHFLHFTYCYSLTFVLHLKQQKLSCKFKIPIISPLAIHWWTHSRFSLYGWHSIISESSLAGLTKWSPFACFWVANFWNGKGFLLWLCECRFAKAQSLLHHADQPRGLQSCLVLRLQWELDLVPQ